MITCKIKRGQRTDTSEWTHEQNNRRVAETKLPMMRRDIFCTVLFNLVLMQVRVYLISNNVDIIYIYIYMFSMKPFGEEK